MKSSWPQLNEISGNVRVSNSNRNMFVQPKNFIRKKTHGMTLKQLKMFRKKTKQASAKG